MLSKEKLALADYKNNNNNTHTQWECFDGQKQGLFTAAILTSKQGKLLKLIKIKLWSRSI